MSVASLRKLFRPESVAVVGASTDPAKIGGRPLHFLKKHGFDGKIWPVNPRAKEVEGHVCFPDVGSLPGTPDAAIILVGPDHAIPAVRDLAEAGCGAAIVLAGGFAETGDAGDDRQRALLEAAGDMRLLGPNTIGLLNVTDSVTLSASGALDIEERRAGGVAVVSQSGGILGSLLSRAAARGVGLSILAATGNEADIDVSDIMEYLAGDDATRVVALYLETIRKPARFRAAARALGQAGKRLVVYKVGRSESGAQAASSHTGALAGEDRVFDGLFRQVGAIRAERYADLVDLPTGLALAPPMGGRRLAILTHTGGAAGLIADVCGLEGFETPPPSRETSKKLGALLRDDGFSPDRNPVDLTLAGLDPEIVYSAIVALAGSGEYDAIVPVAGSSSVGRPYMIADPVLRASATVDIPIVVYASPHVPGIVSRLNAEGIPAFDSPEACARLLAALPHRPEPPASPSPRPTPPVSPPTATGPLNEFEAKNVFREFGIASVRETPVTDPGHATAAAAALGDEVVVKILSRDLMHKTEIGGIRTHVASAQAADVCREIALSAGSHGVTGFEGYLIQEQVAGATEMILGFRRDPALGPAVLIGAGGVNAEVYGDVAIGLLPLENGDIDRMLHTLKMSPTLDGYRGAAPANIDALTETITRFAHMCDTLGERLIEAEINPLFVGRGDAPVLAGDGVMVLAG